MRRTISAFVGLVFACRPAAKSEPPIEAAPIEGAVTPASDVEPTTPAPQTAVVERTTEDDAAWTMLGGATGTKEAIVGRRGALRLVKGGAIVGDGGGKQAFERLYVAAIEQDAVRVAANASIGNVKLLVWLATADLAPQLAREVALQPLTGKPKPGDGAIELAPGELIEILAREGERARVRTSDERFEGWIDGSALAPVFEDKPFAIPSNEAVLAPGTKIFVRKGGAQLYALPSEDGFYLGHIVHNDGKGWVELEYVQPCEEHVRVRGFARAKNMKPLEPNDGGFGCGAGAMGTVVDWGDLVDAPRVKLAKDTQLRTADGELVGRTLADVELRRGKDGLLRVPTAWGLVPVKAD
ncbi:MAG TPA: hypothetical protein VG755_32975 [Nannocystaceae bacterium]|nr:hypothetical protein [Nannocystaceae bacterium]